MVDEHSYYESCIATTDLFGFLALLLACLSHMNLVGLIFQLLEDGGALLYVRIGHAGLSLRPTVHRINPTKNACLSVAKSK